MSPVFSFDIGDASFLPSAESPGFVDAGGLGFGGGLLSGFNHTLSSKTSRGEVEVAYRYRFGAFLHNTLLTPFVAMEI
jgi:hypothetical protein